MRASLQRDLANFSGGIHPACGLINFGFSRFRYCLSKLGGIHPAYGYIISGFSRFRDRFYQKFQFCPIDFSPLSAYLTD
jgi:hypothetical protein